MTFLLKTRKRDFITVTAAYTFPNSDFPILYLFDSVRFAMLQYPKLEVEAESLEIINPLTDLRIAPHDRR